MKERARQRKRECLGGNDRKRNERLYLSLHLGKQPPSAPWPTLLFPLNDTAVIYCSSPRIKLGFYVLGDEGAGFWQGEGYGNSLSEWLSFRRRKLQTLTTVARSREYGVVLQTLLGPQMFWDFASSSRFLPLVLLLCALLLFFMICSMLKDTCCESLVLAWGLTEWKTAFDVVWRNLISVSCKSHINGNNSPKNDIWILVTLTLLVPDLFEFLYSHTKKIF